MQSAAGTIKSQVAEILTRAAADGVEILEELRFLDDGFSGASLLRPALERLRDQVAAGIIDRVYVHSPDRLARKYAYQVLLVDELDRAAVEIRFLNQQISSTPEDALLLQVQGMIAEYERAKIMERCRRGKRHAARCGGVHVLGPAPFGYRYVTKQEGGGEARWDVILEEARVVRRMFERVGLDRVSINAVCRMLDEEGIPTRGRANQWSHTTVWNMLRNTSYKGMAAYGKRRNGPVRPPLRPNRGCPSFPRRGKTAYAVDPKEWIYVPVPRIVSDELFDLVQEQLAENRKRSRLRCGDARWLLQGLVVCKCCGYAMHGRKHHHRSPNGKSHSYNYYRCPGTDSYRNGGVRICDNAMVKAELLEDAVWQEVRGLLRDPQRLQAEYERRATDDGVKHASQLQERIGKIRRGIGRLVDSYAEGLLDKAEFEPRIRDRKARLASLEKEADRAHDIEVAQQQMRMVVGRIEAFAQQVEAGLESMEWTERRDLVRSLVRQVEIDREEVTVCFRVAPAPPPPEPAPEKELVQHCPLHRSAG